MEANEALTLIAKARELVKSHLAAIEEHEIWECAGLEDSVRYLDQAIDKLST